MTTVHLAGNAYQFYLARVPAKQRLSLVLLPLNVENRGELEWARRLYELHEWLDAHFYSLKKELLFKPIFPGSADLLEINVGTGPLPIDEASQFLRQELMTFK
ncbi:MAG: hypothetical protein GC192_06105 [Bacteroidetes bacterium]|nr:hypothetical protein [Bacteroidota bacterium]